MKQYITPQQLSELSEKGRTKLQKWWKPVIGDHYVSVNDDTIPKSIGHNAQRIEVQDFIFWYRGNRDSLPILSIGQMIEILDIHSFEPSIERIDLNCTWNVSNHISSHTNSELCDALWSAVKLVLESL